MQDGYILPDSNDFLTLWTAAQAYLALGYAVIPLHGDANPSRPKVAAMSWKPYQHTYPTDAQLHHWFLVDHCAALGIVTGRISRLVVLDFDTPQRFEAFSRQHPDLADQQVIQTRRGYHIYYHLPPNFNVQTRKGQGIDLLSDGCYVVARPSTINGHTYRLIRGGQPKLLTLAALQRITRFVTHHPSPPAIFIPPPEFISHNHSALPETPPEPYLPVVTSADLMSGYRAAARHVGRNQSLFRASLRARDAGWSREDTLRTLLPLHVQQPPAQPHLSESQEQRAHEAARTIQSAFSRPPRQLTKPRPSRQLPNSVREALLRLKRTDVVRTLEGLLLKGIQPGQLITAEEAITLLKGIVGRDSIYHALNASTPVGQPIFEPISPLSSPIAPNGAAEDTIKHLSPQCFEGRAKKSGIIHRGPKTRTFVMPSTPELGQKLGAKPSSSDPISLDDLATAKTTRMAVHRELIKRRPGIYPRRWLARRLGVCTHTLDTYNRDIPIGVKHLYLETRLNWSKLNLVPDGIPIDGAFLEDDSGKRYPPRRGIAAHLLGQGRRVIYKRQDANYYWYGETPPNLSVVFGVHPHQPEMDARLQAVQQYVQANAPSFVTAVEGRVMPPPTPRSQTSRIPSQADVSSMLAKPGIHRKKHGYRKPLADQQAETLAQQVYSQIEPISQATARRLVDTYGLNLVGQGLIVIRNRHNILNPTAFLISWLRSESRQHTIDHQRDSCMLSLHTHFNIGA